MSYNLIYNNNIILVTDCEMVTAYVTYKLFCQQSVH